MQATEYTQGHTARSRVQEKREREQSWGSAFIGIEGEEPAQGFTVSLFIGDFKTQEWKLGAGKKTWDQAKGQSTRSTRAF